MSLTDTRPCMPFLDPLENFSDALMTNFVMSVVQDFLLVQLWHHYHARSGMDGALLLRVTQTKDLILVHKEVILLLVKISTRELPNSPLETGNRGEIPC